MVRPEEVAIDDLSRAVVAADRTLEKKVAILQSYADRASEGKPRQLRLRFLVSPVEIVGDVNGNVCAMKLVKNVLVAGENGEVKARATDQFEMIDVGMVFRSVGYRGLPLPGVPFNEKAGTILNEKGRVLDAASKTVLAGLYTSGWIKRGPSGVIGTNKPDSVETATAMADDARADVVLQPTAATADAALALVAARQPRFVSYEDWKKLDALELANGAAAGRPRVKFTRVDEMLAALGK